jgi:hypothetical protein
MYDILGFPRNVKTELDSAYLKVTPYHSGPVGLVPDTVVHVSLTEADHGCEVLVRPYQLSADNIMLLDCTMHDAPGVLVRLVEAVSHFDINIVNKVSAATDINRYQRTSMLLDWTTSRYKQKTPSSLAQQRYYRQYHSVFPVAIRRCVELFESIVEHCGDIIVTNTIDGLDFPVLSMRELASVHQVFGDEIVTVKRHDESYQIRIDLPKNLTAMLRISLEVGPTDPLVYIPLAEPDTKTLRVFFPRPADVPRIVHMAFFHLDIPHAYETILHCLREAGFNILTSLIRGHKEGESVVEAVIQGSEEPPVPAKPRDKDSTIRLCSWIADQMVGNLTQKEADLLRLCGLRIGLPLHPRSDFPVTVALSDWIDRATIRKHPKEPILPEECALTAFVRRAKEVTSSSSIFLSYPPHAHLYANALKKQLQENFRVSTSADADFDSDEYFHREIVDCDFFIGIWLPEAVRTGPPAPLLHMELGAAISHKKKAIITYAEGMDVDFLEPLGSSVISVPFSYATFETRTVEAICGTYCRDHFENRSAEESSLLGVRQRDPIVNRAPPLNRAAFAQAFIEKNPQGVTAAELYEAFAKEGIRIQRTYLSSLLSRLQERDLIRWRREDKKYYYFSTKV